MFYLIGMSITNKIDELQTWKIGMKKMSHRSFFVESHLKCDVSVKQCISLDAYLITTRLVIGLYQGR